MQRYAVVQPLFGCAWDRAGDSVYAAGQATYVP